MCVRQLLRTAELCKLNLCRALHLQGTKRAAQSEDDLDSAHSLKRLCSNTSTSSQPPAPPKLVIDVNQSIATGISPRLVGVEELGLLSLRNAAGAAGADLGMWTVLQEVRGVTVAAGWAFAAGFDSSMAGTWCAVCSCRTGQPSNSQFVQSSARCPTYPPDMCLLPVCYLAWDDTQY
jgi:hypothetical protein